MFKTISSILLIALACASAPAGASPQDDLAFDVQEHGHTKTTAWVVERLMTFNLGAKCFTKVLDKQKTDALGAIGSAADSITAYATAQTGDDWERIERQSVNTKAENQAIVDKMIDAFKPKFHLTVTVEGDDCDTQLHALWLHYMSAALVALQKYPPKSGKMSIVINATAKAKGLSYDMSKDGSVLTITGSRDIAPAPWPDVAPYFKRVSTKN